MSDQILLYAAIMLSVASGIRMISVGLAWSAWRLIPMLAAAVIAGYGFEVPDHAPLLARVSLGVWGAFFWGPFGIRTWANTRIRRLGPGGAYAAMRWLPLLEWGPCGRFAAAVARAQAEQAAGDLTAIGRLIERDVAPVRTRVVLTHMWSNIAIACLLLRDLPGMLDAYERARDYATPAMRGSLEFLSVEARAVRTYAECGRWDDAERCLGEFLAAPASRSLLARPAWRIVWLEIFACAGDITRFEAAAADISALPAAYVHYWRGRCLEACGEFEAAALSFDTAIKMAGAADGWLKRHIEERPRRQTQESGRPHVWSDAVAAALDEARTQSRSAHLSVALTPATATLILAWTIAWAIEEYLGGSTRSAVLMQMGTSTPGAALHGEAWRLVAAMFLHAGLIHYSFNAMAMWIIGSRVEMLFGSVRLLAIFFISGIAGNLASHLPTVGASGGVMGALGAELAALLLAGNRLPTRLRRGMLGQMATIILLQVAMDHSISGINGVAHMVGLACGLVLGLLMFPRAQSPRVRTVPIRRALAVIALTLAVGGWFMARNAHIDRLMAQAVNDPAEADWLLNQARQLNPRDTYVLARLAWSHRTDPPSAITYADEALEINPSDTYARGIRAYIYMQLGRYEDAVLDFQSAVSLEPRGHTLVSLGYAQYRIHHYADAVRSLRAARTAQDPVADVSDSLFIAEFATGDFAAAFADARSSLDEVGWHTQQASSIAFTGYLAARLAHDADAATFLDSASRQLNHDALTPALEFFQGHLSEARMKKQLNPADAIAVTGFARLFQGDREAARKAFQSRVDEHTPGLIYDLSVGGLAALQKTK